MRTFFTIFSSLLIPCFALAQDPAMQAAQAAQQAQRAAQQATQQASEANQQAIQATQQAMQNAQTSFAQACCIPLTAPPKFSLKPGKYSTPTTVKITDATRGAVIYYTTDGWTPTVDSPRYRGPIRIDSTTNLQAIAIGPYSMRSAVTSAEYVISGSPSTSPASAATTSANVPSNSTPVPLVFAADVSSSTASVGDKIPLTLSEDLLIGNVIVKKGAAATATVTAVDRTGVGGAPGVISFEVDNLQSDIGPIALRGGATKEGEAKLPNAAVLIPVVGPLAILRHGTDAVIAKGTPFTAYTNPDIPVASAQ